MKIGRDAGFLFWTFRRAVYIQVPKLPKMM